MGTINTSMHAVQQAQDDLSELDSLPPLGQDMVNVVQCFYSMSLPWQKTGFCALAGFSEVNLCLQLGELEVHIFSRDGVSISRLHHRRRES